MNWNRPVNDDLIRLRQLYEVEGFLLGPRNVSWPERDDALASVRAEALYLHKNISEVLNLTKNKTGL